jgi:hypothetical protein
MRLRRKNGQAAVAETNFREVHRGSLENGCEGVRAAFDDESRLLASNGRRDEARSMLAEIYNWFTESFDTSDLKEAKSVARRTRRSGA